MAFFEDILNEIGPITGGNNFAPIVDDIGDFVGGLWNDITGVTAAETAADAQSDGVEDALDQLEKYLSPYTEAGEGALEQMQILSGAMGPEAQRAAIDAIQNSPEFLAQLRQGENSILQNASATGGLRGGNTQGALAQFAPSLLQNQIQQQFSRLGGLTGLGANAAGAMAGGGSDLASALGGIGGSNALANYDLQSGFVKDFLGFGLSSGLFDNLFGGGGGTKTGSKVGF